VTSRRTAQQSIRSREEAACWHAALQNCEPDPQLLEAWEQWIAEPANQQVFDETTELWTLLEHTADYPWPTQAAVATDSYDCSLSIVQWQTHLADELSAGHSGRAAWWIAVIAAVLAALGLIAWWVAREPNSFTTGIGEHKQVALSDGSRIELGGKSAITVATAAGLRAVVLDRGEALFKIAQNANRPFQVIAATATITSPGAEFNVRRREGGQVAVTVATGTVEIGLNDLSASRQLHQHQQLTYDSDGQFGEILHVSDESPLAWRDGLLVYESESLKFVVADLNRYSARRIEIGDREAGEALLTGVVYTRDLDNWLPLLPQAFPSLDVTMDKHRVLIRTRQTSRKR